MEIQIEISVDISKNGNFVPKMMLTDIDKNSRKVYWEAKEIISELAKVENELEKYAERLQKLCNKSYSNINQSCRPTLQECFQIIASELDVNGFTLHSKDDIKPDELPCEHLNLSIRAKNLLRKFNITSITKLCSYTRADLLNIKFPKEAGSSTRKSFGVNIVNQIEDELKEHGLYLREVKS